MAEPTAALAQLYGESPDELTVENKEGVAGRLGPWVREREKWKGLFGVRARGTKSLLEQRAPTFPTSRTTSGPRTADWRPLPWKAEWVWRVPAPHKSDFLSHWPEPHNQPSGALGGWDGSHRGAVERYGVTFLTWGPGNSSNNEAAVVC